MAGIDPVTTEDLIIDLNRTLMIGTKTNYVSILRQFWFYCMEFNIEVRFDQEVPPHVVVYWMHRRTLDLGSCNSIRSWQAAISWMECMKGLTPRFYMDPLYRSVYQMLNKLYKVPRKKRSPVTIQSILRYLRLSGITPYSWRTVKYDKLMRALAILLMFFSMSRPSEIFYTDKTENIEWEEITTGIRFGDL